MTLLGLPFPQSIDILIDGAEQNLVTRIAELDELTKAIDDLDEDISRLLAGAPALIRNRSNVELLRQEKAALIELQKRASRSGCPGTTTVVEALFPDIPATKKTAREKAEIEAWLAIRKEEGSRIDPKTAEFFWDYGPDEDPYGVRDRWELPEKFSRSGHQHWARNPGSDIYVHFNHVPDDVREKIWAQPLLA